MKEIKIGRSNDNDIVIDDNSVSRNHAIIFVSENSTMIQDNNSTNGTFINGRRIQGSSPLQTNDILKVGNMPVPWRNYVGAAPSGNANQSTRVTPNQNQYIPPQQINNPAPINVTKKKSPVLKIVLILLVLALGIITLVVINNPNALPGMKLQINTPKPMVVEYHSDQSKTRLFDRKVTIYATVFNQGGAGNVIVTFKVSQGNKSFDKSKSINLAGGESQKVEMTFDEVNYYDGEITFSVTAVH